MKKVIVLSMVLAVLLGSGAVMAQSQVSLDGLYMMGNGSYDAVSTKDWALSLNGEVEVYSNVLVDASFASSWAYQKKGAADFDKLPADELFKQDVLTVGAKYRLLADPSMAFSLGAGYAKANIAVNTTDKDTLDGWGIYGKGDVKFAVSPQISVNGSVSYTPAANFTFDSDQAGFAKIDKITGSIATGRGAVVYHFTDAVGVQVGITYSAVNASKGASGADYKGDFSTTTYGAGVSFRF